MLQSHMTCGPSDVRRILSWSTVKSKELGGIREKRERITLKGIGTEGVGVGGRRFMLRVRVAYICTNFEVYNKCLKYTLLLSQAHTLTS
jgi:hypothetical protein